jgi:hypothetical protein
MAGQPVLGLWLVGLRSLKLRVDDGLDAIMDGAHLRLEEYKDKTYTDMSHE